MREQEIPELQKSPEEKRSEVQQYLGPIKELAFVPSGLNAMVRMIAGASAAELEAFDGAVKIAKARLRALNAVVKDEMAYRTMQEVRKP